MANEASYFQIYLRGCHPFSHHCSLSLDCGHRVVSSDASPDLLVFLDMDSDLQPQASPLLEELLEGGEGDQFKWYILQTQTGYESRIERSLQESLRAAHKSDLIQKFFIPSEEVIQTRSGKKRVVKQKYFPGYVFILANLTDDLWHILMDTPRVSGFVGGDKDNPLPVSPIELRSVIDQINSGAQQTASTEKYETGQKVIITEGPFSNFNGTVGEIRGDGEKLQVFVSIFGRMTPVEVDPENIKRS